jgi:sigma-B regulation protein RsbU (phosphoserine phosphatase)
MSRAELNIGQHYQVLIDLAKNKSWVNGDLDATLREVIEAAATTMGIERVNVWLFDEERTKIRCIKHYERSTGEHTAGGAELAAADYPVYFQNLIEERTIVVDDVRSDPRTSELVDIYLDVHGITSMLDAPLRSKGKAVGIICHEHVGEPRIWTRDEQQFAASLADLVSLALESSETAQAVSALRQSQELTQAIIAHALDAIVIITDRGLIRDWNPRAETIFGWSREEAIGMTLFDSIIPPPQHEAHRLGLQRYLEIGEGPILNRRIETSARDRQGREFPIELTVSPVRIGDALAFSGFIRDITDRMSAELEVHNLNAQLEERVQKRTQQLKAAVEEKERLLDELQKSSVELLDRLGELEHKSETIRSDLEQAQIIQRALLPADPPRVEGVHVDALYRPGMSVGGDLYDVTVLGDGRLAVYVADAAGHGVAAAMLSVIFKQRLRMCDPDGHSLTPSEVLRHINKQLSEDVLTQGLFLTVCYVLLDPKTGELRIASAGHTPILLMRSSGESILLKRTGPALGIAEAADFSEHQLNLNEGDRLMLYTDGLVDGLDSMSDERIVTLLEPAATGDSRDGPDRLRSLYRDVEDRATRQVNAGGRDDVTLLMLVAETGTYSFDNDPPEEQEHLRPDPAPDPGPKSTLWIAETAGETQLAVHGQGTWMQCENFRRLARAAIETGQRLRVDLANCSHLDSAFLGTLHDIVTSHPDALISVHVPSIAIRGFFAELGLEEVISRIDSEPCTPACEPVPVTQDAPERASQMRLLRAHEILSELSEENHDRFSTVVNALRGELRQGD